MSVVIGIGEDFLLLVIAGLPAIAAFVRGAGALRWLALVGSLFSLLLFALASVGHNPLEGGAGWVLLAVAWIAGWLCALLAIRNYTLRQ